MAKRVNPQRRAAAQAALVRQMAHDATVAYNADTALDGRVRSPLSTIYRGQVAPHMAPMEGRGVAGKVVRGQLKRVIPGTKSRFAQK